MGYHLISYKTRTLNYSKPDENNPILSGSIQIIFYHKKYTP